jgi:hypothetical protein
MLINNLNEEKILLAKDDCEKLLLDMLNKNISFFEGSHQIIELFEKNLYISQFFLDSDFDNFKLLCSETDHLPRNVIQDKWNSEALKNLKIEFDQTEIWAETFIPEQCKKMLDKLNAL